MGILIDTNIAIHWRDGDVEVIRRAQGFSTSPVMSIITQVELTNGLYSNPEHTARRRTGLNRLCDLMAILSFDDAALRAYDTIVKATGFSRPRMFDRMIAATAIVHDLTLITINGEDFRDIPGLSLEVWPHPAAQ